MKVSNFLSALLVSSMVIFSGCGDDSNDTMNTQTYSVKLVNITSGQPMSPMLVSSDSLYTVGESASVALEKLAEGGDNSELLNDNGVSGSKLITPSQSDSVTIDTSSNTLSVVSMLVATNDGFAGMRNIDVSSLHVNDSKRVYLNVLDAGTEVNSEAASDVPGLKGEGFNAQREASNIVTFHSGVITKDEGLSTSDLNSIHKFNNPAAMVVITRTN